MALPSSEPADASSPRVAQDNVLSTAQAVELYGRHRVEHAVRSGQWQRPARGVVVAHSGPPTEAQQHWIALLACARGSVLGGITALRCDGFTGFHPAEPELPQIVQPMGASRPTYQGAEVHWSEYLGSQDVHPLKLPPRNRPARAAIDEASWTAREGRARAIVLAVVQQRMTTSRHIREALSRRGSCRHRALIVESVLDAAGGIQSLPERDFDNIRASLHLPKPTRQAKVRRNDGRFYLDVAWREYSTACEIHGIPHLEVIRWESDLERANEVSIDGPRLLTFSSYAVRRMQSRVGDQLVRMLRRGGWAG